MEVTAAMNTAQTALALVSKLDHTKPDYTKPDHTSLGHTSLSHTNEESREQLGVIRGEGKYFASLAVVASIIAFLLGYSAFSAFSDRR